MDGWRGGRTDRVGNDLPTLDIEPIDLLQRAGIRAINRDELRDQRKRLGGIDRLLGTVKLLVTHTIAVEITPILIAQTAVPLIPIPTVRPLAPGRAGALAGVRRVGRGIQVGLPDVHLGTARAVLPAARVGVVGRAAPPLDVGLSVDELDVRRALGVAVPRAVLGTGLVGAVLGETAVLVHLGEVDRAVEAAGEFADVDVEGEFLVEQVEHAVLCVARHEVDARSDVGAVVVLGDELQLEGAVCGRGDAVGLGIVGSVNSAFLGAGLAVGAGGCVPLVAVVAVCVACCYVGPAPVGL